MSRWHRCTTVTWWLPSLSFYSAAPRQGTTSTKGLGFDKSPASLCFFRLLRGSHPASQLVASPCNRFKGPDDLRASMLFWDNFHLIDPDHLAFTCSFRVCLHVHLISRLVFLNFPVRNTVPVISFLLLQHTETTSDCVIVSEGVTSRALSAYQSLSTKEVPVTITTTRGHRLHRKGCSYPSCLTTFQDVARNNAEGRGQPPLSSRRLR
jgi:hypothetical protein